MNIGTFLLVSNLAGQGVILLLFHISEQIEGLDLVKCNLSFDSFHIKFTASETKKNQ